MKKYFSLLMVFVSISVFGQDTSFDNLNANFGISKSILWYSSSYGSGFGHRIINSDPGGQTLLNFQGRHNSGTWSNIMSMTSNGKVGIGTDSPQAKLDIVSAGTIGGNWNPSGSFLKISDTGSSSLIMDSNEIYGSGTLHIGSKSGEIVRFRTITENSTSDKMVIEANGNVGIGTMSPEAKLDIYGANSSSNNLILSANYKDKFRWRFNTYDRGDGIDLDITASDNSDTEEAVLKLSRSNSGRPEFQLYNNTLVANNTNVGIGTNNPSEKLDVLGTTRSRKLLVDDPNDATDWNNLWQSGFYQSFDGANVPESNQWFWGINMNHGSNNPDYRYNGQLIIKNHATAPKMYFRSTNKDGVGTWAKVVHSVGNQHIDGALGIGTTNPDAKLTVKGNIHAEEVKIDLSVPAPDYVFTKEYDLLTIEEVQQHITEKGHLPNIPSAKEMEANGVELGVMNMKLLEKIEELTLYTIEQQKKIEKLEQQEEKIKELEQKLNTLLKSK
ncbi:hypothetical protein [Aquimarina brevivitae]|uniref:Endosialidase-like protein n=1 Tax=Aquimarina brevivitae TaxID=323412 RepID=A0A4Q7NZ87_9FLAO|nr:hypothetical protein [Aquimarina brevivitae]RZS92318.1 hypothetical protein EV197_2956 [Aquimarina brevivitae]